MPANKLRHPSPWFFGQLKASVLLGSLVAAWMASCSLRDLDELESGAGGGGTDNAGGSSGTSKGGSGVTGAAAGTGNTITTSTPNIGGSGGGGNTASGGVSTNPGTATSPVGGGGVSTGGQGTLPSGGVGPVSCPAATTSPGKLIVSADFETGLGAWGKVTGPSGVSVVSDASACLGNAYLSCDGATRQPGGWDGPALDLFPLTTLGASYHISAAVRLNSKYPITDRRWVQATIATYCSNSSDAKFTPLVNTTTTNAWARIQTTGGAAQPFVYKLPSGCSSIYKLALYFETSAADEVLSVELDDVYVWEVPGSTGSGGASGMAGAAGAAGLAGMAGSG